MPKIVSASPVATWFEPSVSTRTPKSIEDAAPASAAQQTAEPWREGAEAVAKCQRDGEAGHRADQHHAFDAEIEHAALLDHQFAGRREQDRGRHADHGHQRVDDEGQHQATACAGATRGASRMILSRYRTRMSLARMKNSIVAWKMPAVASGTCTTVCATCPPT